MSWLAAARKRVLEMLACSASPLARPSSVLSRGQLLGALLHAAFERFVRAFELLRRLHARRDVGEGRDDAAVRHAVRAHLHDQVALGEALEERLAAGDVARDALAHQRLRPRRRPSAPRAGVEAQDLVERRADAGELRRQFEDLAELPVPADQVQLLVEHRDALAHVVERGLQDFAVVVDRRIGVVEQLERRLGGHACACAAAATARGATTPRRSPTRADARRSAGAGSRLRPWGRG